MLKKITNASVKLMRNYLPDPFLFCIILTLFVFIIAMPITAASPVDIIAKGWYSGFWTLLAFSMQMALVLVTGHTLANAPSFKKGLSKLASIAKTPLQAIYLVTFISLIASWINWGFGLVIGAIFARQLAKQVKGVDYRLLIASAYSGFLVWHGGISGSIPLKLASGGSDLSTATAGAVTQAIPTSQTIFSLNNIIILLIILVVIPIINVLMHPKKEDVFVVSAELLEENIETVKKDRKEMTPAEKLENSFIISLITFALGFTYIVYYFIKNGFSLNLNIVNFVFLFFGVLLHKTPINFLNAIKEATKGVSGIILQFPFYAGIMGIMIFVGPNGNSIAGSMSDFFVNISNEVTFPFFTFLSAGIVNFFVPSGGGQWAVQAPIMMPASIELGVPVAKTAMAIAWGDAWTNMIQPFWALPALGIAKLGAKDIMGFCLIDLIFSGIIIALSLMIL